MFSGKLIGDQESINLMNQKVVYYMDISAQKLGIAEKIG